MRAVRSLGWGALVAAILAINFVPGVLSSAAGGLHFPGSRYYTLPSAAVDARVRKDGSVRVVETITFSFHGTYSGAFRDIPLGQGQSVSDVQVAENGLEYAPGASTVLGSYGTPGSFGDATLPDRERIVWHYSATDEPRAFTLSYVLHGVLIVHPDVIDLNMNVWGADWPTGLGSLIATVTLPPGAKPVREWGNPPWIRATLTNAGSTVELRAHDLPDHHLAALRLLVPSAVAKHMTDVQTDDRVALPGITAAEQAAAGAYQQQRDRLDTARRLWPLTLLLLLVLATIPVGLVLLWIYLRHGREFDIGYHEQYEREPPSGDRPALVPSLVAQHAHVGSREFTATLFDLIVRKHLKTLPADGASLAVSVDGATGEGDLEPYEQRVLELVGLVEKENGGPIELARMGKVARGSSRSVRSSIAARYRRFGEQAGSALRTQGWVDESGSALRVGVAVVLGLAAVGLLVFWFATQTPSKPFRDAVELAAAACLGVSCVIALATPRRVFNRRRKEAALLGDRWDAFRRFLHDFPRFADAVPVQIEIWERLLVYGIAFGLADRILDEAKLRLPAEALEASPVGTVWIGGWGGDDLAGSLGGSFTPPPSASSGSGGGGFSGGGGGSFGGGGGGAW